ncbi:GntR family transcriptional regulator [Devosia algicola]|uniref:GntR family transcriptional regulator n=1 Tax=Devosia algicola TaxID=3026418 RepID=A0ABY7YRT3_9HYPH|nr:GntR family transcriptional regulator [Devosia algicola]WDR03887.1 GntR family transcriptional regulator [Devosia algicola]
MTSAITRIVTTLYEDIVLGIFPAGNKLAEERLAERFSVKRHTIREAFLHLEELGFIDRVPNRGVLVREMTPTEVREIYDVRAVLESHAASVTKLPVDPDITDRMAAIQERHSKAIEDGDYRAVLHLNTEFHRTQFSACANTTLVAAIEDFAIRVHAITAMKYGDRSVMERVTEHHWEIIEAMKGTDNAKLIDTVLRHFDLRRVEEYGQRYRMKYGNAEPAVSQPRRLRVVV